MKYVITVRTADGKKSPETDAIEEAFARLYNAVRKAASQPEQRYTVDGSDDYGNLSGEGRYAPFRIFDAQTQDWLPFDFQTRANAESYLRDLRQMTG